jgi:hypothetical protein
MSERTLGTGMAGLAIERRGAVGGVWTRTENRR